MCVCPRHRLESGADAEQRMTALILGADCLSKRRELMATWAAFATTTDAEIIPFLRLS